MFQVYTSIYALFPYHSHFLLKREAIRSSETLVPNHNTTRRQNPEDRDLNLHSCKVKVSMSLCLTKHHALETCTSHN